MGMISLAKDLSPNTAEYSLRLLLDKIFEGRETMNDENKIKVINLVRCLSNEERERVLSDQKQVIDDRRAEGWKELFLKGRKQK